MDHIKLSFGFFLGVLGSVAYAIPIQPESCHGTYTCWTKLARSEFNARRVSDLTGVEVTTLLYELKPRTAANVGPFADSYSVHFYDNPIEPNRAVIEWINGTTPIDCFTRNCVPVLKDERDEGEREPTQYLFDRTERLDGTSVLDLQDLWSRRESIGSLSFWAGDPRTTLPEPDILSIFALGLAGLGFALRYKNSYR